MTLGPHVQSPTPAALAWSRRAPIVKALDNPEPLTVARPDATLIFRAVMNDWGEQLAHPNAFFQTVLGRLGDFRAPGRLYVELLNELPKSETARYIAFARVVVPLFHAARLKVIGPNWATGDYEQAEWNQWRAAGWVGIDCIGLHAYWADAGFTVWNALRWRSYYDSAHDHGLPVAITECGRDRVRDGSGGAYLGRGGWKADSCTPDQYAKELNDYAAHLLPHESALAFGAGANSVWANYELDSIAPLIASTAPQPQPKPPEKPMPKDFTSPNHDGPRLATVGIVLHGTLGGSATPQTEFDGTVSWFNSAASQVSAHAVVGPGGVVWRPIHTDVIGWHCRASNGRWLGLEMAKPRVGDKIAPDILDAAAKIVAGWCHDYEIPLVWSTTHGLAEHHEMPTNTDGHQDVGGPFDRADFLARVKKHAGGDELTQEQRKAVLDDLDFLWSYSTAEQIKKNPAESEKVLHERIVGLKVTLGLQQG